MRNRLTNNRWQTCFSLIMILALTLPAFGATAAGPGYSVQPVLESDAPLAPSNWCVAGSFQGWDNASAPLYDDGSHGDLFAKDGLYSLDYLIASPGDYEWKIVQCGNWGVAYPAANAWFTTAQADHTVKFLFDSNNHAVDAGPVMLPEQNIVNIWHDTLPASFSVVGDFQGWNNSDPNTAMASVGYGFFHRPVIFANPGNYIGKIVATGSWRSFGADGRSTDGANFNITTTVPNETVIFWLDAYTGRVAVVSNWAGTASWCVAGSFQGWDNASTPLVDDGSAGDLIGGDGIYSRDVSIATPGRHEFKAVQCGDWSVAYPPNNSWLITNTPDQTVKITFDTNDHSGDVGLPYLPKQNIVNAWYDDLPASFTAVGDFQGWNNADPATTLSNLGYGLSLLNYPVANPGMYNGKFTGTGSWDNQFDAAGRNKDSQLISFQVFAAGDVAQFVLDTTRGRSAILTPAKTGHGNDNNVEYYGLGHDSQDDLYRVPFGAVTPGTQVILRFRTYHNDVTRVRVRLWDTSLLRETLKDMTIAASDVSCYDPAQPAERCDFWQLAITPTDLTTLWYRFIVQDGTATAYYADDRFMNGGWGQATPEMVDNSYAITVYDPAFQPLSWMQNAVVYQVFPDRFRNGRLSNDPTGEEARYGYPPEALDQIIKKSWNELPEGYCRAYSNPAEPCTEGPRGRDYFGGDLIGLRAKLPYLYRTGVKVIYLNPIFESGSNHGYDTQDYEYIESFFGTNKDFIALANGAHQRGMKIIIDGVFNHMSSDSPLFDRYGHYDTLGACESLASPYRDWFIFHEVTPGSGQCEGQGGAKSATYDSWYGFDSIPVLNKFNPDVKAMIFEIAQQWLVMGADGWRLDVMPDPSFPAGFWEEFRAVVLAAKPDAAIIGELWKKGDVLPLIHGNEADTTMDYRFRNAILGFLGKVDNKGFPDDGQSNQPPSLFAEKLLSEREDYPDATYFTLMRLMDSHDTQRILWSLTPGENNREAKEFNLDNLAQGKQLLRLAAAIQMTIPGAPTIYYGDEVAVTGDDDPDDRRTFPWQDQGSVIAAGSEALAGQVEGAAGDLQQLLYYRKLIALRASREVFREGELSFLLTDDTNRTMAYLMRTANDAAIVAINRSDTTQTLAVDVSYALPWEIQMKDVLGSAGQATAMGGVLTFDLPPLSAAIWLPVGYQNLVKPAAPANLVAVPGNGQVELSWEAVGGATLYAVYRSPVTGGGYEWIEKVTTPSFTDTNVTNGKRYYYAVSAIDASGLMGARSGEAGATPYYPIGWAGLQWPHSIDAVINVNPTENVYGQAWVPGITDSGGDPASILAQLGYGAPGSDPDGWTWKAMAHNAGCSCGNNYEYMANLRPEQVGTFSYLVRFSSDGGINWTYGYWSDGTPGTLNVLPAADTTPPAAPANLRVVDWGLSFIQLEWDAVPEAAEYWIYRAESSGAATSRLAIVNAPATGYTDTAVDPGATYFYVVKAVDAALNVSPASNEVAHKAEPKLVNVTFRVLVPDETPVNDLVYIAGGTSPLEWNPSKFPMTQVGTDLWEITLQFPDGTNLEYKFTRGSWERVEWWGSIVSVANRRTSISYGTNGTQLVENVATDWGNGADDSKAVQYWRDPLVESTTPADGVTVVPPANVTVAFSRAIQPLQGGDFNSSIVVESNGGAIPGTVSGPDNQTLVWTPAAALGSGTYQVTVFNLRSDLGGESVLMQAPYVFSFTVTAQNAGFFVYDGAFQVRLPLVRQ